MTKKTPKYYEQILKLIIFLLQRQYLTIFFYNFIFHYIKSFYDIILYDADHINN